jgi:hypothetical protein
VSNYLTSLVRRGAGLAPRAGDPPTIRPRHLPDWMLAGPAAPADSPGFQVVEEAVEVPTTVGPASALLEPTPPLPDPPGPRRPASPAWVADGGVPVAAGPPPAAAMPGAPVRRAWEPEPEPMPPRTEVPRPEPPARAIHPRGVEHLREPSAPDAGPTSSRSAPEDEPPVRTVRVSPPAAGPPPRPEAERTSIPPARSVAPAAIPRIAPFEPVAEAVERPPAILPLHRPPTDPIGPEPGPGPSPAPAPAGTPRLAQADEPAPVVVRDRPRAPAPPLSPLRPAAEARSTEERIEAIREQRVTVRIGAIEIRVPEPRRPPEQPPPAPAFAPPAPAPAGFDAYTRLRTYAPWSPGDRP